MRIVFIILFAMVTACKTRNPSVLKHEWGASSRGIPNPTDCSDVHNDPEFNFLEQHTKEVLEVLRKENPGKFENICIQIVNNESFNASMSDQGVLRVNTGLFKVLSSDAQIAWILAHEVAHFSMGHTGLSGKDPLKHPKLRKHQEYALETAKINKYRYKLDDLLTGNVTAASAKERELAKIGLNLSQYLNQPMDVSLCKFDFQVSLACDAYNEAFLSGNARQRSIETALGIEDGELNNWTEQEADEVGNEFFVRSGFDFGEGVKAVFFMSSLDNAITPAECYEKIKEAMIKDPNFEKPFLLPRGKGTHPRACWRIWNLSRELDGHPEVQKSLDQNGLINLPNPTNSLTEIKKRLEKYSAKTLKPLKSFEVSLANASVKEVFRFDRGTKRQYEVVVSGDPGKIYELNIVICPADNWLRQIPFSIFGPNDFSKNPINVGGLLYKVQTGRYLIETWPPEDFKENDVELSLSLKDAKISIFD